MRHKFFRNIADLKLYNPSIESQGDLVSLHLNENVYDPPTECISAASGMPEIDLKKYERNGCFQLESKLSDLHGIDPKNILIENGSSEVLKHLFFSLAKTGTKVLLPKNGWAYNNKLALLHDLEVEYYPLTCDEVQKKYSFDVKDLEDRIKNNNIDILLIVTPNAFTGNLMKHEDLYNILKLCGNDTLVIVDQAYTEYSYHDDINISKIIKDFNNVIFSRTFSKFYALANLRIGYAISNEETIDYVKKFTSVFGVSGVCQAIACRALDNHSYYDKIKSCNDRIKNKFLDEVNTLKHFNTYYSEANFVLVQITKLDVPTVLKEIKEGGIVIGSCKKYGLDNYMRVTIGTDQMMDQLFELLFYIDNK